MAAPPRPICACSTASPRRDGQQLAPRAVRRAARDRAAAGRRVPGDERAGGARPRHRDRRASRRRPLAALPQLTGVPGPAAAGRRDRDRRAGLCRLRPYARTRWRRCSTALRPHAERPARRRLRRRRRPRPRQAAADGPGREPNSPTWSMSPTTIRAARTPATIRRAILAAAPGAIEIGDRREAIAAAIAELRRRRCSRHRRQGPRNRPDRRRARSCRSTMSSSRARRSTAAAPAMIAIRARVVACTRCGYALAPSGRIGASPRGCRASDASET